MSDLISREALKKAIKDNGYSHYFEIFDIIDNAPTAEPPEWQFEFFKALYERVRPQGEWIKGREISRTMIGNKVEHIEYKDYTCSNCGLVLDNLLYHYDGSPFYKFCPNCGTKMITDESQ